MDAPNLGIDDEDFSLDLVPATEKSFGIRFEYNDLQHVLTYGELCEVIQHKLPPALSSTCTTQQAFYKLRLSLRAHAAVPVIFPDSRLAEILPPRRINRRQVVQEIEKSLGMELNILGAHPLIESVFISMLLLSFLSLLVSLIVGKITGSWTSVQLSLVGLTTAVVGMQIANRFGTTLKYATVRELVLAMRSRFYRQSRRDPSSVNQSELIISINELLCYTAGIDSEELTPDAILR